LAIGLGLTEDRKERESRLFAFSKGATVCLYTVMIVSTN
jgi:hypothetical protein